MDVDEEGWPRGMDSFSFLCCLALSFVLHGFCVNVDAFLTNNVGGLLRTVFSVFVPDRLSAALHEQVEARQYVLSHSLSFLTAWPRSKNKNAKPSVHQC